MKISEEKNEPQAAESAVPPGIFPYQMSPHVQETLNKQLEMTGTTERKELFFHQKLLNGQLPLSIGGGIGQSRLCMFFLRKAHIGEIQAGLWPDEMIEECQKNNIFLL